MKHPLLVWITLGLSALSLLVAVIDFFGLLVHLMGATYVPHGIGILLTAKFVAAVYLGLVVYGVIRRTRWGHGICISYALLLVLGSLLRDPVAMYRYSSASLGLTGLRIVHIVVIGLFAFYAFMVTFGSRPFREYFAPPPEPDVPVLEPDPVPADSAHPRASLPPGSPSQASPDPARPGASTDKPITADEQGEIRLSFD